MRLTALNLNFDYIAYMCANIVKLTGVIVKIALYKYNWCSLVATSA